MPELSYDRLKEILTNKMSRHVMPREELLRIIDFLIDRVDGLEDPKSFIDNKVNKSKKPKLGT